LALAQAGADVAIGSLPESASIGVAYSTRPAEQEMGQAKSEIEAAGARCFLSPFDLRSDESVEAFHRAAVAALGPIGILVNAAGVCAQELMTEARDDTWSTVLDINLTGAYRTTRRCLSAMLAAGLGPHRQYRLDGIQHRLRPACRLLRLQAWAAGPRALRGAGGRGPGRDLQHHQPGHR
jgi:Short-chain alcohol dehydrogenase of unknown specificity